jgi:hypothetical protein
VGTWLLIEDMISLEELLKGAEADTDEVLDELLKENEKDTVEVLKEVDRRVVTAESEVDVEYHVGRDPIAKLVQKVLIFPEDVEEVSMSSLDEEIELNEVTAPSAEEELVAPRTLELEDAADINEVVNSVQVVSTDDVGRAAVRLPTKDKVACVAVVTTPRVVLVARFEPTSVVET